MTGLLAGCSTTQEQAAREQLLDARQAVSAASTRVVRDAGPVEVLRTAVVSGPKHSAYVVTVVNRGDRTIGDLPISIGYRSGSHRVYLNAAGGFAYFGAHLPPIAAHHELTWVSPPVRRVPHGAALFALVGSKQSPRATYTANVPVRATVVAMRKTGLRVKVTNLSDIVQYQLEVYAYSRSGNGYGAAGSATIGALISTGLAADTSTTVDLHLIGANAAKSKLKIEAIPTTLQ